MPTRIVKFIFIILGSLSLALGIVGAFIPGLPTTPFVLLAATLYIRSSEKLYHKLISNKIFGPIILEFKEHKGTTLLTKVYAIMMMWIMISISLVHFIKPISLKLGITALGIIGTIVMGFVIPTITKKRDSKNGKPNL